MNDLFDVLSTNFDESFSPLLFLVHIVICSILLFFLSLLYVRYGNSISNRKQLGKVLMLVGVTTFIIISIVKSSLALSLGLVGALSIIRFRTAIKEPEELGYFFMAISLGLGLGANQLVPTLLGFLVLGLIIVFSNFKNLKNTTQNLLVSLEVDDSSREGANEQISGIVVKNSNQVDLKRLNYESGQLNMNFQVNVDSLDVINRINKELYDFNNKIKVTFIDSQI